MSISAVRRTGLFFVCGWNTVEKAQYRKRVITKIIERL